MTYLPCQFNALRTLNSLYETLRTFVRLTRKMSDRKLGIAGKASDIHEASRGTTVPPPAMPPFNTATSVLGTRCAHGHTHGRTGQSLRNTHSGECGRCVAPGEAAPDEVPGVSQPPRRRSPRRTPCRDAVRPRACRTGP